MADSNVNPMHASPRCTATSKRSGKPCRNPAVNGWYVCRMHGARGGAPTGSRHGRYKTGQHTQQAKAMNAMLALLMRESRQTLTEINQSSAGE